MAQPYWSSARPSSGCRPKSDSSGSSTTADPNAGCGEQLELDARGPAGCPGPGARSRAFDGSTLTVETSDNKTVTVTTSDKTTVTQTDDGSVSDIAAGDHLLVMGTTSGSQTEAQRIVDTGSQDIGNGFGRGRPPGNGSFPGNGSGGGGQNPPNGFPNAPNGGGFTPPVTGTVTQVDDGTITLKTSQGETVTVTTTSSTTVTVRRTAKVSDLAEGDTVLVIGKTSGDTIAATSISKGDAGGFGPGGGSFPGGGNFPGGPPGGSSGTDAGNPTT